MAGRVTFAAVALLIHFGTNAAYGQIGGQLYISGLMQPVGFEQDPSNPAVQYVVEQRGVIRVILNGVLQPTAFLDITSVVLHSGERGLLGLAFPADYAFSRRFFVHFTNLSGNGNTVVSRFKRSLADPLVADPASRFDLVWPGGNAYIAQPFTNHKAGRSDSDPTAFCISPWATGAAETIRSTTRKIR